jgi:hypothetical protein
MPHRCPMLSTLDRARLVSGQARTATRLAIGISLLMSVKCVAGDFAGCYELRLTQWSPALSLGDDLIFVTPPSRVALTTTPDHTWDEHAFRVNPERRSYSIDPQKLLLDKRYTSRPHSLDDRLLRSHNGSRTTGLRSDRYCPYILGF